MLHRFVTASSNPGPLLRRGLDRCAVLPRAVNRTLWVHGASPDDFRAAEPLLDQLAKAIPRFGIRWVTGSPETWRWLRERHPRGAVLAAPFDTRWFARRFVSRVRPDTVVLLGSRSGIGARALARLQQRRVAIALVDGFELDRSSAAQVVRIDRFCVRSVAEEKALLQAGVPPSLVEITGALPRVEGSSAVRAEELAPPVLRTLASLEQLLARARAPGAIRTRNLKKRLARSLVGRWLVALRTRRIASWDALAEQLARPRTILCLGNGPSSEDPRVLEVEHDALFRVNSRWLERGLLTRADVIFTGEPDALIRVPGCIYVFRSIHVEERALRRVLFEPRLRRVRYLTYERTDGFLNDPDWRARPSNGAIMIATAVALQPERLVIAGIDLFADPSGSYPGDTSTPNAYTPVHDRDVELQILDHALAGYRGEAIVIGDVLNESLRSLRQARADAP